MITFFLELFILIIFAYSKSFPHTITTEIGCKFLDFYIIKLKFILMIIYKIFFNDYYKNQI